MGIEKHKKKLETHFAKLEKMYINAPDNEYHEAGISVSAGEAEIVISIRKEFFHAAGSVHSAVCFKAMNDAASLAVNSIVDNLFVSTLSFNIYLARPVGSGELIARGRFMNKAGTQYMAESVLTDSEGREIGKGNGTFVKSRSPLSPRIGYG
ncbi:PaaI family thioesterase [bacterium]|nr:PaaI family thioesterase [bacterium]